MNSIKVTRKKSVIAIVWSFIDTAGNQLMQGIVTILLARLILPKDFGIVAILLTITAIALTFVDSGFSNALIKDMNATQTDYSTIFYFNSGVAIIIYFVFYVSANFISSFYKIPELGLFLRLIGIVVLINSIELIQRTILIKSFEFKKMAKVSLLSSSISGVIAIILAFRGFGIWSLVIKIISMQLISCILLCYYSRWVPSAIFKVSSIKKYLGFSSKVLANGLIVTLSDNIYNLVIGKVYLTSELGFYAKAEGLNNMVSQTITNAINRVAYPMLSSKLESETFRNEVAQIDKSTAFINIPIMVGILVTADNFVGGVLGEVWLPMVPFFRILCLAGILYPFRAFNVTLLQVKGRPDLSLITNIITTIIVLFLLGLLWMAKLDSIYVAWVRFMSAIASVIIGSYFCSMTIKYTMKERLRALLPIMLVSTIMGVAVFILGVYLPFSDLLTLSVQVFFGVLLFVLLSKALKLSEIDFAIDMFRSIIKRNK